MGDLRYQHTNATQAPFYSIEKPIFFLSIIIIMIMIIVIIILKSTTSDVNMYEFEHWTGKFFVIRPHFQFYRKQPFQFGIYRICSFIPLFGRCRCINQWGRLKIM